MKKIRCLIVEDEPLAAEVLQDYIAALPFLELACTCTNALDALELLQREPVDLLFLDIHLPRLNGLDFLRTLAKPPKVIVTTAYPDYALQGFELSVVDYLLKPVDWNRFLTAVNKVATAALIPKPGDGDAEASHIYFNVNKRKVRVSLNDILYIESLKEYIRIVLPGRAILTKFQLTAVEDLLAPGLFIRIHRSFIVAKNKIDTFSATDVEVGGKQLPIGRNYKDEVLAALGGAN